MRHPQLNSRGELTHLITTEGLSRVMLTRLLDTAEMFLAQADAGCGKVSALHGKRVLTFDTDHAPLSDIHRLAREADILMVKSSVSGLPYWVAQQVGPRVHVMNERDGCHAAPIDALMDMLTIRQVKKDFSNLTVAIVGDILHSPVARSNIHALTTLGTAQVRVVGPLTLLPEGLAQLGVQAFTEMKQGLGEADVIIMLGFEPDKMRGADLPSENEYLQCYGLTAVNLACAQSGCLVIHRQESREVLRLAVQQAAMSIVAEAKS